MELQLKFNTYIDGTSLYEKFNERAPHSCKLCLGALLRGDPLQTIR